MEITIVKSPISFEQLKELAEKNYGDMVKGVADIRKNNMALGGELHADAEAVLLEQGASQADLWGFNIYPDKTVPDRVEYTSLINIRPSQGNRSIEIKDTSVKAAVLGVIDSLVRWPRA